MLRLPQPDTILNVFQYANDVLNTFKSFKLESIAGKRRSAAAAQTTEQYFAKYLTNQNLLHLQLSDSNFRRFILVQFLILFQYLQSTVKPKGQVMLCLRFTCRENN